MTEDRRQRTDEQKISAETHFTGIPISGGIVVARVCLFNERRHSKLPLYKVTGKGQNREKARLKRAVKIAADRLEALKKDVAERIGSSEAKIFAAQKMILLDKGVNREMMEAIENKDLNAETAVATTLEAYETRLLSVDNEYIKNDASDIGEIKRRLLDVLRNMNPSFQCAGQEHCQRGRNRIVVAEELTPSLTLELNTGQIKGFVTERGGKASHAAILARALGIPAVSGLKNIHSLLDCGTEVLINGETGEVVIWPGEETISKIPSLQRIEVRRSQIVEPVAGFKVMANISLSSDVVEAKDMQTEGIGLYRTEFEFMSSEKIRDGSK
ncbi:MAG: phosphoenolpyruvate-utilizing N-terminal domain-containing protein [bacterium]